MATERNRSVGKYSLYHKIEWQHTYFYSILYGNLVLNLSIHPCKNSKRLPHSPQRIQYFEVNVFKMTVDVWFWYSGEGLLLISWLYSCLFLHHPRCVHCSSSQMVLFHNNVFILNTLYCHIPLMKSQLFLTTFILVHMISCEPKCINWFELNLLYRNWN